MPRKEGIALKGIRRKRPAAGPAFVGGMTQAIQAQFADIPEREEDIALQPSPELRQLVQEGAGRIFRQQRIRATVKRTALAMALVLCLTSSTLAIPSVRRAVAALFLSQEQDHYAISEPMDPSGIAVLGNLSLPAYISTGYVQTNHCLVPLCFSAWWDNETGGWIHYMQMTLEDPEKAGAWFGLNAESVSAGITVGGREVFFQENGPTRSMLWSDGEYLYSVATNRLPRSELAKVVTSISVLREPGGA